MANITFRHDSPQHCAEQIEALAALAVRAA
jgi:hypothetical protein